MDFFNDLGKKLSETAKTVGKKSEELVEVTKLNLAVGNEEEKIRRLYEELGSELYKEHQAGKSLGEKFDEMCGYIRQCELNISDLKEKIQTLKGVRICKSCKGGIESGLNFCPHCGAKLEDDSKES